MKKYPVFILFIVIFSFLIIGSCKKDPESPAESGGIVDFILSPESLYLADFDTVILYLSTKPSATLDWQATSVADWIELQPSSGTITNNIQQIKVISNPSGLDERDYYGIIEIISNGGGKSECDVILSVGGNPIGKTTPTTLNFSENIDTLEIVIENTGTGQLEWQMNSSESWLSFQPSSGITTKSYPNTIKVIADRSNMPVGDYSADISIQSNSYVPVSNVSVQMQVAETATFGFDTDTLNFGYFKDEMKLVLKNTGNVSYEWNMSITEDYITSDINSGFLNPSDEVEITFMADRDGLSPDQYLSTLLFSNNKGVEDELVTIINKFNEEKWMIDAKVIDAEYDRKHDVIIVVTEYPYQLLKLDPKAESIEPIALNLLPLCVSIHPDGTKAVVGHDSKVTYVDLISMSTIEVYNVSEIAFDIVHAPNNYAYIFPATGQWTGISCLNLNNGVVTTSGGYSIYDKTYAKLHPSGDYIYGANTGLSPSDFEKYDITAGTASYMYDSPYHGDYSFSGNIWISDDGVRLFAKSRNVFFSSTNQNTDMTYNGSLSGEANLVTLDHSSAANRIYTVEWNGDYWDGRPSNTVKFYDAEYMNFQGSKQLPGFLVPNGDDEFTIYDSEGYFGFFNSEGTKFYVLVKAEASSGLLKDWAVAEIDVE